MLCIVNIVDTLAEQVLETIHLRHQDSVRGTEQLEVIVKLKHLSNTNIPVNNYMLLKNTEPSKHGSHRPNRCRHG